MPNLFEMLGIKPTDDFKSVKKAYIKKALSLHPDKLTKESATERKKKEQDLQELNGLFSETNTEEKFHAYVNSLKIGSAAAPASAAPTVPAPTDAPPDEFIDIFVPIALGELELSQLNTKLTEAEQLEQFLNAFSFEKLANVITENMKHTIQAVGMTFAEAKDIINLHSHYDMMAVVQLIVPLNRLSAKRHSERELAGPRLLSAREGDFFWLLPNTIINAAHILNIQPLKRSQYQNSIKFSDNIIDIWPTEINPKIKSVWYQREPRIINNKKYLKEAAKLPRDILLFPPKADDMVPLPPKPNTPAP